MATLALNFVIGFGLNLLGAALQGTRKVEGPRLSDLHISSSTEGTTIPITFGPWNRISPQIIEGTDLNETKSSKTSGGKFGIGGTKTTGYSYDEPYLAIALCQGPIAAVGKVWADSKLIANFNRDVKTMAEDGYSWPFVSTESVNDANNTGQNRFASMTIYNGSETQDVDSTLEAAHGVNNVSAYRGTAYIVIDTLQLADFGNHIPTFSVEVFRTFGNQTVGDAIGEICELAGLAGRYNTRAATDALFGFAVQQVGPAQSLIADLMYIYDLDACEIDGILHFLPRYRTPYARVTTDDLGVTALQPGKGKQRAITTKATVDLPKTIRLTFPNRKRDFQSSTVESQYISSGAKSVAPVQTAVVLNAGAAKTIVDAKLRQAWRARKGAALSLPQDYLDMTAGEVLQIQDRNGNEIALWMGHVVIKQFALECEGNSYVPAISVTRTGAEGDAVIDTETTVTTSFTAVIAEIAPLEAFDDHSGLYAAAGANSDEWRGGALYVSWDAGSTYTLLDAFPGYAVTGSVPLVPHPYGLLDGPTEGLDELNELTVQFDDPDYVPSSLADGYFYNHAGGMLVGDEAMQAQTVVDNGDGTFTFSNLMRGLNGTDWASGHHAATETVLLVDPGGIGAFSIPLSRRGQDALFKFVPSGIDIADVTAVSHTFEDTILSPLSPAQLEAEKDESSGDWNISFVRRTRYDGDWADLADVPLNENTESYEIDIIDPDDGVTVLRTLTANATPTSVTWTAAQQTSDYGAPSDFCFPVAYQLSDKVQRGRGASLFDLAAMGDSLTRYYSATDADEFWPAILVDQIGYGKARNFGHAGETTAEMIARFGLLTSRAPTVIGIYAGTNDSGVDTQVSASPSPTDTIFTVDSLASITEGSWINVGGTATAWDMSGETRQIASISGNAITLETALSSAPTAGDYVRIDIQRNIEHMIDLAQAALPDAAIFVVGNHFDNWSNAYAARDQVDAESYLIGLRTFQCAAAQSRNLPYIDCYAYFSDLITAGHDVEGDYAGHIANGDIHLNAYGERWQVAEPIIDRMGAILQQQPSLYVTGVTSFYDGENARYSVAYTADARDTGTPTFNVRTSDPASSTLLQAEDATTATTVTITDLTCLIVEAYTPLQIQTKIEELDADGKHQGFVLETTDADLQPTGLTAEVYATTHVVIAIQTAPPGSPSDGDAYGVDNSATGAWAGQDGSRAIWRTTGSYWDFYATGNDAPNLTSNTADGKLYYYSGSWIEYTGTSGDWVISWTASADPGGSGNFDIRLYDVESPRQVINMTTTTAPSSPSVGDSYIAAGDGGAWTGKTGHFMRCTSTGPVVWTDYSHAGGWPISNLDDGLDYYWNGSAWVQSAGATGYTGTDYIKRTLTSSTTTAIYSAAQQVTDYGYAAAAIAVAVYEERTSDGTWGFPAQDSF